ncbi:GNAT family N-acetyltransferase [Streptomyces sp. NBC_01476]|uniref:GNAT family N-acetyltransferase n=1 Tax=Streptomyces sp. NBC_01476 TaxID=2903881 RepID=UPI002E32796E|nr:GNAT family N-acetyltransferase [Streptomyces sp. NBC_01476]
MTTTLRPTGPERREADGTRARSYAVRVNSRTVGALDLGTDRLYGPRVGRITALGIAEADRRRGRGTVAALAAEEVLRSWGCDRVEAAVPAGAEYALRMAAALGYTERQLNMVKELGGAALPLPAGSSLRPLTDAEYGPWRDHERAGFIAELMSRGIPREQAAAHEESGFTTALPDGPATEGTALLVLEHDGDSVGILWVRTTEPAWVYSVEVGAAHRGRGHGRTLMRVAEQAAAAAGAETIGLNVFAGNTPALRLYGSLGYRPTRRHFAKTLL